MQCVAWRHRLGSRVRNADRPSSSSSSTSSPPPPSSFSKFGNRDGRSFVFQVTTTSNNTLGKTETSFASCISITKTISHAIERVIETKPIRFPKRIYIYIYIYTLACSNTSSLIYTLRAKKSITNAIFYNFSLLYKKDRRGNERFRSRNCM